ncbi:hypothetical protein ASPZODRAFT_138420 [Penicilliopsis zonata CBS 506.65]|uniref:Uncharacterized protein n=1 Tax=Penicilliopsis zonata CBS 506.65 TaxID=1073090 RepID=A0A1L9SVT1_9EURO|nr:hypothetical protein ASPZODRAFT_138420 [Penicilliopsis zonata CBS 506.65]OJJ51315.1 hypothetical protein ASPZODRAFT_138420 [Penicilliopsis zonata CBS 506.65]
MSFGHGGASAPGDGMDEFLRDLQTSWGGVPASSYVGVSLPYCTGAFPSTSVLTPISLPDSSFVNARPSPVLSHHSQDYQFQHINEPAAPLGLGITAPLPSDFPRTVTAGLSFSQERIEFASNEIAPEYAQSPPAKRVKRTTAREAPISILPHPEGLQRLEQQRRQIQTRKQQTPRPRAPGRNRRDPQAEEEDAFVENLREQNKAWKVIREMFCEKFKKDATEARLQMRMLRRRKDREARWDEHDTRVLMEARDYWESEKYEFIAQKMRNLGARQPYTAQQCEAKLRHLDARQNHERLDVSLPQIHDSPRRRKRVLLPPIIRSPTGRAEI